MAEVIDELPERRPDLLQDCQFARAQGWYHTGLTAPVLSRRYDVYRMVVGGTARRNMVPEGYHQSQRDWS